MRRNVHIAGVRLMTPIINPWLFYLVDVIGSFQILSILIALLIILSFAIEIVKYDEAMDELDKVKAIKTIKKKVIVIALLITFAIFLPSKKTCYQMMIASQITDNNIQKAEDTIKESVDYIFEKINEGK